VKHKATLTVTAVFELGPEDLGNKSPEEMKLALEALAESRVAQWFPERRHVTQATATIREIQSHALQA
jgi:hypothetical protein